MRYARKRSSRAPPHRWVVAHSPFHPRFGTLQDYAYVAREVFYSNRRCERSGA